LKRYVAIKISKTLSCLMEMHVLVLQCASGICDL
jgi:hypothetical protein